jgi:hypothetical protein
MPEEMTDLLDEAEAFGLGSMADQVTRAYAEGYGCVRLGFFDVTTQGLLGAEVGPDGPGLYRDSLEDSVAFHQQLLTQIQRYRLVRGRYLWMVDPDLPAPVLQVYPYEEPS